MRTNTRIGLALLMALPLSTSALSQSRSAGPKVDRFTFGVAASTQAEVNKNRHDLVIHRWATDAERDQVQARVAAEGVAKLPIALASAHDAGYLHLPGSTSYTVRYARRVARPDGSADVVVVVDRPVWTWWNGSAVDTKDLNAYTVLQLRLPNSGAGEGKLSVGEKVDADKAAGVVLGDFGTRPAVLNDVRHEPLS